MKNEEEGLGEEAKYAYSSVEAPWEWGGNESLSQLVVDTTSDSHSNLKAK